MKIQQDSKLVMTGDSITDCGRTRPFGIGDGLGDGYVRFVGGLLAASYPKRGLEVTNTGIGGNTTRDLKNRWQSDVIDLKPNWVSVMIGTNDVWRQFAGPQELRDAVMPDEFEATYMDLVARVRPSLDGMVLMTPFYVQPDKSDAMRARMDEYGPIVERIAKHHDCLYVDTQELFDQAMETIDPAFIAEDKVHPSLYGSAMLARGFLKVVGFEF